MPGFAPLEYPIGQSIQSKLEAASDRDRDAFGYPFSRQDTLLW